MEAVSRHQYNGEIIAPDEEGNWMVAVFGLSYPKVIPRDVYCSMSGGTEPQVGDIVRVCISEWTGNIVAVTAP